MNLQNFKTAQVIIAALSLALLAGCEKAETTIVEKDPIVEESTEHDHDHEHSETEKEHGVTGPGRLLVVNADALTANFYDLSDGDVVTSISLDALPSAVYATGGFRYAALIERNADTVGFIDGGLWQEAHEDHFDLVASLPSLLNVSVLGSRPTHFVTHEGQVALFLDGNAEAGTNAGVRVFNDHMLEDGDSPWVLDYSMPMHGVAEPRGDYLLATIRRDDSLSTSQNFVLPDQVGVFHLHDGAYELESTFEETCPDLHGAAQNETHIIFGCSDGVLVIADNGGGAFSAAKLANPAVMADGLRVGSVWGHHESSQFIGQASSRESDTVQLFVIDPEENEFELLDWQPQDNAKPIARDFAYEAEQFIILDSLGYLTSIEPHVEGEHTHWEYASRLDITDADITTMPEGASFSMTFAQNSHTVYISDPIEQHVLSVDLEQMQVTGDIELDYIPSKTTWLGIVGGDVEGGDIGNIESHEHD